MVCDDKYDLNGLARSDQISASNKMIIKNHVHPNFSWYYETDIQNTCKQWLIDYYG